MKVQRKSAAISNTGDDDAFPGSFEVVLSTGAKDRDGDELAASDWKQPLPEHITFDVDHGMSVASTVGSGAPSIDDQGRMVVSGTYSSLPRAQEVRTLVKEGHIRTTSVAFMSENVTKDGKTRTVRELLNGAFVAIPSNREAVVLGVKTGARNSASDAQLIQGIHDAALSLGAQPAVAVADVEAKGLPVVAAKAVDGSYEQREQAISEALHSRYPGTDVWAYSIATFDDSVVFQVGGGEGQRGQWQATYTYEDGVVTLGDPTRVALVEHVVPKNLSVGTITVDVKAMDPDSDPGPLALAVDAALDQAMSLLASVDASTLPEPVQQAVGLVTAAGASVDALLEAMNITNPDETEETTPATDDSGAAAKSVDADALDLQYRALSLQLDALATE